MPNQLDCLVRLQLGQVDAVVTDNALAAGQAAQDPAVELKGGKPFTTEFYGVATKLGKDDLVRRVNKVLDDYRKGAVDGGVQQMAGGRSARDNRAARRRSTAPADKPTLNSYGTGPAGQASPDTGRAER